MKIVDVIPIARGIQTEVLSYIAGDSVSVGNIVEIPLRKKVVQGIVSSERDVPSSKAEIKNASFALKKIIKKVSSKSIFSPAFLESVSHLSEWYASSDGAVLDILTSPLILESADSVSTPLIERRDDNPSTKAYGYGNTYLVQGDDDERFGTWKSIVRQEFARNKSVFLLLPTSEDTVETFTRIEKGIEGYAVLLHSKMKPKEILANWNKILEEKHPVVIVGTGTFLSIPRYDISTIIVEREHGRGYKIPRRPFVDMRQFALVLSKKMNTNIYYGDILLRTETLHMIDEGTAEKGSPFKFRSLSTANSKIIDMKKPGYEILSEEVSDLIDIGKENSKNTVILAVRRGMSPTTVCGDCGTIVTCRSCSSPVVLHDKGEKRFFMCHRCGERRSAEEYCIVCNSWKLTPLGVGVDRVDEYIKERHKDVKVFRIDSDMTPTEKKAKKVMQDFLNEPGSVLIGTEMMLHYLHDSVDQSVVVSLDSLFALPDFRIQEKIMWILLRMRALSRDMCIVQTRKRDEVLFDHALDGNVSDFVKANIENRRDFGYPPFTTLIKITAEGKKDDIVKEMQKAQDLIRERSGLEMDIFPAFTHTVRGQSVLHGLIKIPRKNWINRDLLGALRSLPQSIAVNVDPESLL